MKESEARAYRMLQCCIALVVAANIPREYMVSTLMYAVPTAMLPALSAMAEISFHPAGAP